MKNRFSTKYVDAIYAIRNLSGKPSFLLPTLLIATWTVSSGPTLSAPRLTTSAGKVTAITGLSTDEGCFSTKISGTVVKRQFTSDGLYLNGVVVEEKSGERSFVNVDDNYKQSGAAMLGNVKRTVETMLNIGKRVSLGLTACGAAGRMLTIDSIKPI